MDIEDNQSIKITISRLQWFIFAGVMALIVVIIFIFLGVYYLTRNHDRQPECVFGSVGICNNTDICIGWSKVCDRYEDCPDGSDEINCECLENEYACKDGRCISVLFLCDDTKDCPLGDDEIAPNCETCKENEIRCRRSNQCIEKEKICDNVNDCYTGSDETNCYSMIDNMSVLNYGGKLYAACADEWNDEWNHVVCTISLKIKSDSTDHSTIDFPKNYKMMKWNISSLKKFKIEEIEECDKALLLDCQHLSCGQRPLFPATQNLIIDGRQSKKGYFPWFATLILRKHAFICGAGILSDTLLITAEHCVLSPDKKTKFSPQDLSIQVGNNVLSLKNTLYNVSEIIYYKSQENLTHDVALLRLSEPLQFNDLVQPVCIDFVPFHNQYSTCVIVGHGTTTRKITSEKLLFQRIFLVDFEICRGLLKKGSPENEICLSSLTKTSLCQGDSGGPLLCTYDSKVWFIAGINSYVYGIEHKIFKWKSELCKLSVAMKMTYYRDWVANYL